MQQVAFWESGRTVWITLFCTSRFEPRGNGVLSPLPFLNREATALRMWCTTWWRGRFSNPPHLKISQVLKIRPKPSLFFLGILKKKGILPSLLRRFAKKLDGGDLKKLRFFTVCPQPCCTPLSWLSVHFFAPPVLNRGATAYFPPSRF